MFRYFILRPEQQLFCYLYGCALALVLMVLFSPVSRAGGFYLVALSVALLWAGLALYTRHTDRMRRPEVSPQVSIRDGIQVVAMLPRHEKARLEWEILQDADVYRRQMLALQDLAQRCVSRGLIYAPAVMLAGLCFLAWGFPQDAVRGVTGALLMLAALLIYPQTVIALLRMVVQVIHSAGEQSW